MKNLFFDSWRQWRIGILSRLKQTAEGLVGILYCLSFGFMSIFVNAAAAVKRFALREPLAMAIISAIFLAMAFGWGYTFTTSRASQVSAQHKVDSLAYSLNRYTEAGAKMIR